MPEHTDLTGGTKYLVIACDGGGIRGLITALLLNELETKHSGFLDSVNLHAGTSTGGIISLGMACGISASAFVTLYEKDGATIFTESTCRASASVVPAPAVADQVSASLGWSIWSYIAYLICPWYTNTGLSSAIQTTLGSKAQATLDSLVANDAGYVLVNTLQLQTSDNVWAPLQLTNLPNIPGGSGATFVIDAAMSTSAAPMYFPPYNHPTYGYCADGGLFANNPGATALAALLQSGVPLANIWMLSLSTGNTQNCYPSYFIDQYGDGNFGPLDWLVPFSQQAPSNGGFAPALPMLSAVFDATSDVDGWICGQLLGGRYQRANVPLGQPITLDDYSAAAITEMKNSTNGYISSSTEWANICKWIKTNFGG